MSVKLPIRRLLAEGFVIVVSVLLALSADAWWDSRQEDEATRQQLTALAGDLATMREELDSTLAWSETSVAAGQILLAGLQGPTPELLADSAIGLYTRFLRFRSISIHRSAYDALISSGRMVHLADPELVAELGRFFSIAERAAVDEQLLAMEAIQKIGSSVFASEVGFHNVLRGYSRARVGTSAERVRSWSRSAQLLNDSALFLALSTSALQKHHDLDRRLEWILDRMDSPVAS